MIQQVTVTAEAPASLKPLLEAAIRNELKLLTHGLNRTRERLAEFEKKFGMSSEDFDRRFRANEIEETLDFIDWQMEIEALRLLENQYQTLREARLD